MMPFVRHELMLLRRSPVLMAAVLAYALALAIGIAEGARSTAAQADADQIRRDVEREWVARTMERLAAWEATGEGNEPPHTHPSTAGGSATNALLPPAPLATLGVGQTELYPSRARVAMWMRSAAQFDATELYNPVQLAVGRFDANFVVVHLLPLLLIGLCAGMLSRDRASGLLRMTLSHPVSLRQLLAARVVAVAVLPVLATTLILGGAVMLLPGLRAHPVPLLAWWGAVLLYALFWILLAAWIDARSRSVGRTAVTLAALWLLWLFVVPAALTVVLRANHPVPSRIELTLALRAANQEMERRSDVLLETHYRNHPELVRPGADNQARNKQFVLEQRAVEHALTPLLARFDTALAAQQRAVDRYRMLSPAVSLYETLNDVGGTGPRRFAAFREQVGEFQHAWAEHYGELVLREARVTHADWQNRPVFEFREASAADTLSRAGANLALLLAFVLLAGAGAWLRSGRTGEPE